MRNNQQLVEALLCILHWRPRSMNLGAAQQASFIYVRVQQKFDYLW